MRHVAGSHNAQVANLSSTQLALYVAISALGSHYMELSPQSSVCPSVSMGPCLT